MKGSFNMKLFAM